jgi:hypothetical protein
MRPTPTTGRIRLLLALVSLSAGLTGCVSSDYRRADKSTPRAVPLGWESAATPVGLTLQTVIVYDGPGSWKANAYWDEYIVTLRNPGTTPQTVTRALLTDFQGSLVTTGDQPWALESQSRTQTKKIMATTGNIIRLGSGATVPAVAGLGYTGLMGLTGAGGMAGLYASAALLPLAAGVTVYRNVSLKHQVEEEFARRRLTLPLTLAPGQELTGSFFFPVTPGPRHLQVQLEGQSLLDAVDLPLLQLKSLHLEAPQAHNAVVPEPVTRNGKHYLTVAFDTSLPGGTITANGELLPGYTPSALEVEVDRDGRLLEDLYVFANVPATNNRRGWQYRILVPTGKPLPAKVDFLEGLMKVTPYSHAGSRSGQAP